MFITKKKLNNIDTCLKENKENIERQEKINKQILKTLEAFNESITSLERIVKNQPLIKKYQKTLDIFLKNAQD